MLTRLLSKWIISFHMYIFFLQNSKFTTTKSWNSVSFSRCQFNFQIDLYFNWNSRRIIWCENIKCYRSNRHFPWMYSISQNVNVLKLSYQIFDLCKYCHMNTFGSNGHRLKWFVFDFIKASCFPVMIYR